MSLTISIVPDAGGAEWLVFNYSTTSGGPFSCPTCGWSLNQVGLDAAQPLIFNAAYSQFNDNGTALVPTGSIFPGYSVATNPVPGESGTGLGASGFGAPIPAGPIGALGAFINPWSFLDATGITSANVNGYEQALEFFPQTSSGAPGPAAGAGLPGIALAVGAIGLFGWRRKWKNTAAIAAA